MPPTGPWLPEGHHFDLHIAHVQPSGSAVPFTGGGWKIVWHSTEGNDFPTMDRVLRGKRAEPHLLIGRVGTGRDDFSVIQYFPLDTGARALEHPAGTPATNSANCIQVEICGYAKDAHSWGQDVIHALAQLTRLIEHRVDVPRKAPRKFSQTPTRFTRFTPTGFISAKGHVGHQHVPSNSHWDPGALPIAKVFNDIRRSEG